MKWGELKEKFGGRISLVVEDEVRKVRVYADDGDATRLLIPYRKRQGPMHLDRW